MGRSKSEKRKPSIHDLSRMRATRDEIDAVIDALVHKEASPTVVAVLGVTLIDHYLEEMIRLRLPDMADPLWTDLTGEKGPLATFHQRIIMGKVLRIYKEPLETNLHVVRVIRNQFAHARRLFDFDDQFIRSKLASVVLPAKTNAHYEHMRSVIQCSRGGRSAYIVLCVTIASQLLAKRSLSSKAAKRNMKRREKRLHTSSFLGMSPLGTIGGLARSSTVGAGTRMLTNTDDAATGALPGTGRKNDDSGHT